MKLTAENVRQHLCDEFLYALRVDPTIHISTPAWSEHGDTTTAAYDVVIKMLLDDDGLLLDFITIVSRQAQFGDDLACEALSTMALRHEDAHEAEFIRMELS